MGHCQNSNSCAPGIAAPRESGESLSPNAFHLSDMVEGVPVVDRMRTLILLNVSRTTTLTRSSSAEVPDSVRCPIGQL